MSKSKIEETAFCKCFVTKVSILAQPRRKTMEEMFYSNCLLEALKAKIKNPRKVTITYIPKAGGGGSHYMWSDGEADYDFGKEQPPAGFKRLLFKGTIRKRALGFNKRYKRQMAQKKEFDFIIDKYYDTVNKYLIEAIKKHPDFPKNVVEMVSIMAEEAGEAIRAANTYQHEKGQLDDLITELYQTAAMCIRCLIYLDNK